MEVEQINIEEISPKWFIDIDWQQSNNRSFLTLAKGCLCPKCQDRLRGEISITDLLTNIKGCCAKTPGFIRGESPILESVFRLFLANGNQPLDLEEVGKQLSEWRGGDTYRTSVEMLSRLFKSAQYYGLRQLPESG
ncbi:hypothetical protein ACFLXT_00050 [Chloroflexota bacterium]